MSLAAIAVVALSSPGTAHAAVHPLAAAPPCGGVARSAAAALAEAHRCGYRVEAAPGRTETSQVFANPDGTSTMEISAQPRRVRGADGSWRGLDTSLHRNADGTVSPAAVPAQVRLSGAGGTALASVGLSGASLTLGWPAALPHPTIVGDTANYPEVYPGVDLRMRVTPDGFTDVLVVKSAAAAANPALRAIRFTVQAHGLSISRGPDGTLLARSSAGTPVIWSGTARSWDSAPSTGSPATASSAAGPGDGARVARAAMDVTDRSLTVRPDPAALTGPGVTYPVYIDPPFSYAVGAARWAYESSNNTTNDTTVARVGLDPASGVLYRSLFQFPMSAGGYSLSGSRIISAKVTAQLYHSYSCTSTPIALYRTDTIPSTPRTTWSLPLRAWIGATTAHAHKGPDACGDQPNMDMSFTSGELKTDLQNAASNGWSVYPVMFSAATDTSGAGESTQSWWKKLLPSTVSLVVQFNHLPDTPTLDDMSIAPSVDCVTTPVLVNARNGLTLRANLSDADGDTITPSWSVSGVGADQITGSGPAVPGTFTASVAGAALTDGATYTWTVQASDGLDSGGTSPGCRFTVDNSVPQVPGTSSTDLALGTGILAPPPAPGAVVGKPAMVTLAPAPGDANIGGYLIGVSTAGPTVPTVWVPAAPGGTTVAPVVPPSSTVTSYLSVRAVNVTGQNGSIGTWRFKANPGGGRRTGADATGDGIADTTTLAAMGSGGLAPWRWDGTGGGAVTAPVAPQGAAGLYPDGASRSAQGDFTGDGRTDLAVATQVGTDIAVTVGVSDGNQLAQTPTLVTVAGLALRDVTLLPGDFTGDGLSDLALVVADDQLTWHLAVLRATGTGGAVTFAPAQTWYANASGWSSPAKEKWFAGDVNGDGKVDVGLIYDYGSCQTKAWQYLSTGTAFAGGSMMWDGGVNNVCWNLTTPLAGDFTGDGRADLLLSYDYQACRTGFWLDVSQPGGIGATFSPMSWDSGPNAWCAGQAGLSAADATGDGLDDLVAVYHDCCTAYQTTLYTFTSGGTAFAAPQTRWSGRLGPPGGLGSP